MYRGDLTGQFNLTGSLNYVLTSGLLMYPENHYTICRQNGLCTLCKNV